MFCERCGKELLDTANFCEACGYQFNKGVNQNKNEKDSYEKDTVLLEVRPTFKFSYLVLPKILSYFMVFLPFLLLIGYSILVFPEIKSINLPIMIVFLVTFLIYVFFILVKTIFVIKQFENSSYIFYPDRVIFKDSFLNLSERELKYKHIREITKSQTFIQRFFDIGSIIIYSNAETGYSSGISMRCIENVDETYKKVKKLINA